MATKKVEPFGALDTKVADLAKALSHPARIAILRLLAQKNRCSCGEIVDILPLAQSTVSQHLKELKRAGLVNGEIGGAKSCYWINCERLNEFRDWIRNLFRELRDCC
ncbi:MAG: ArsR/SmtB family transcription factor [bacterium]